MLNLPLPATISRLLFLSAVSFHLLCPVRSCRSASRHLHLLSIVCRLFPSSPRAISHSAPLPGEVRSDTARRANNQKEEDGVMTVKFRDVRSAEACVAKMNGRFFDGRKVSPTDLFPSMCRVSCPHETLRPRS